MNVTTVVRPILALTLAIVLLGPALGQGQKVTPPPGGLDDAGLLELLKDMGFEPTIQWDTKNVYRVTIDRDRFKSNFSVSLSTDLTVLWLLGNSARIKDPNAIPAGAWAKLLEAETSMDRTSFGFDKSTNQVLIQRTLNNRDLNAARLRKVLDQFHLDLRDTWPLWRSSTLQPPPKVADSDEAKKARASLQGDWNVTGMETGKGQLEPANVVAQEIVFRFAGDELIVTRKDQTASARHTVLLDAAKPPATMDLYEQDYGVTEFAVWKLEGDTLTIAVNRYLRPAPFAATANGYAGSVYTLQRRKP